MSENFLVALRNKARGGASYRHVRHRIFLSAHQNGSGGDYNLGPFLRDKLLKIRKGEWFALAFDNKDWRALDEMRADPSGIWSQRYLPLTLDYISANIDRVRRLYEVNTQLSAAMLVDDGDAANHLISTLDKEDDQSLFALRALAAQFSFDADGLTALLKQRLKTDWLKKRYLYPLVFQAINAPSETNLEDFLSFVVTGEESESESATLRFLLRDDLLGQGALGFKSYIALLCHPYDACEIVLNHIEAELSNCGKISPELLGALVRLHKEAPSSRTDYLLGIASTRSIGFALEVDKLRLRDRYGFDERSTELISRVASTDAKLAEMDGESLPKPLAVLVRMRARRYPSPDDFNYLVHSGRSWWFCEAGRLINALMTALYMVPRRETPYEVRDLLRLVGFFGNLTPFLMTSPSSARLGQAAFMDMYGDLTLAQLEKETSRHVLAPGEYADRMWIKAVQWALRDAERRLLVGQWLATVREEIRIAPAYLTGIDWSWLESVIKLSRLRPFVGNPTGIYALLLLKVEERDRRSGALRTAIEPLVDGRTLPEVVDWLIREYGVEATAFARFLLEADDLLWLGLAPNRTAALAGRIYALEQCVRKFHYSELLPQALFEQEWNTLNSALLLMSVNAGQFEIPWSVFIRDAAAKQLDLYTAAHSLEPSDDVSPLLATARVTSPYRFRNEKVVTYSYPGLLAPVASLIIAVVEDFLAHPAFGLEMILSTRFRHDTMRREFSSVLEAVGDMFMQGVWQDERRAIIDEISKPILSSLDEWLDTRMHTSRPGKPDALFDIVPTPEDMISLTEQLEVNEGVDKVISDIVAWLKDRLEQQIPIARKAFETEVPSALQTALALEKARLLEERKHRTATIELVTAAAHTALDRRANELVEWFKGCPESTRPPLTFGEIKVAADGLFESYKERRGYRTYFAAPGSTDREVVSDKVRATFDLLREVFAAALEHTEPRAARVRMSPWNQSGVSGLRFSNLSAKCDDSSRVKVEGDPYVSLHDVIFREGNSGLAKIAAIAATIVGHPVSVEAVRRKGSFHLFIPLWENHGASCG